MRLCIGLIHHGDDLPLPRLRRCPTVRIGKTAKLAQTRRRSDDLNDFGIGGRSRFVFGQVFAPLVQYYEQFYQFEKAPFLYLAACV